MNLGSQIKRYRNELHLSQEELAEKLGKAGIAVRAGLHCAPLAHESAGTLDTGTVRISYGVDASPEQTEAFLDAMTKIINGRK